jgi:hypothetical protein
MGGIELTGKGRGSVGRGCYEAHKPTAERHVLIHRKIPSFSHLHLQTFSY